MKTMFPLRVSFCYCYVYCGFAMIFAKLPSVTSDVSDYCTENTYSSTSDSNDNNNRYYYYDNNSMRFTKEPIANEYGIVGNFKALHCCAKGYRSIEWYKNGRPYPWPDTSSKFFLYPQSANQTIHTPSVTAESAGNYTCLLKNDTVVKAHTIRLFIYDKVPDEPKVTYVSDDREVNFGETTRLFCEAFLGHVDLPDAHYEITWTRYIDDFDYVNANNSRISQEKVSREDNQIFGTYLTIEDFEAEDSGRYTCKMSKPGRTKEHTIVVRSKAVFAQEIAKSTLPWQQVVIVIGTAVLLVCIIVCYYDQCRVSLKDRFGRIEDDADDRGNGDTCCASTVSSGAVPKADVTILHSAKDDAVVERRLRATLQSKYVYECATRLISDKDDIVNVAELSRTKRILIVLSRRLFDAGNWTQPCLCEAIERYRHAYGPDVIYVAVDKLPPTDVNRATKNAHGVTSTSVLRDVLYFDAEKMDRPNYNPNTDRFWLDLRYKLPPNRRNVANAAREQRRLNAAAL